MEIHYVLNGYRRICDGKKSFREGVLLSRARPRGWREPQQLEPGQYLITSSELQTTCLECLKALKQKHEAALELLERRISARS
jgi:hypothetical protein